MTVKHQVDLPDDIDKRVAVYKIENNLSTKPEAIVKILARFFGIKLER